MKKEAKPLIWIAGSKKDLMSFPRDARGDIGHALHMAQIGSKAPASKPLQGFGGASVLEVVQNFDGDTYRAVYTVRFEEAVYVLHCFQKKSTSGIATPRHEIELIKARLRLAEESHEIWNRNKNS